MKKKYLSKTYRTFAPNLNLIFMVRKTLKTTIILAFLAGFSILGYSVISKWYDKKYGKYDEWHLSSHLIAVEYNNGEIGVRKNFTKKIIGKYDDVRPSYSNSLGATVLVTVKDNLRGYISAETGETLFEPQFLYAWIDDPESGLAACVNEDRKLGFVNVRTKETVIPFQFDYNENLFAPYNYYSRNRRSILDFVFSDGICIVPGKDGKIGIIDKTGKILLPTIYSDIINWRDANTPNIILKREPFSVGIGIVSKYCEGYVKITKIIQDEPAFLQGDLKKNDIILKIKQENEKYYTDVFNMAYEDVLNLISGEKGTKVMLSVQHENASTQDITIVRDEVRDYNSDYDCVYGICDRDFKMLVPFEYNTFVKNIYFYGDEYELGVKNYIVSKDGKYGILDTLFNVVLPLKYDNINPQDDSYTLELNGKYGIADSFFKIILPAEYDRISTIYTDEDCEYLVKTNYVQKLYDKNGNLLNDFYIEQQEPEYDYKNEEYIEISSVFEPVFEPKQTTLSGYIQYYLDGYYGIIDDAKRVVIPAKYDKIEYLGNGNFACDVKKYSFIIKDKK
jgi:hypothetical protein